MENARIKITISGRRVSAKLQGIINGQRHSGYLETLSTSDQRRLLVAFGMALDSDGFVPSLSASSSTKSYLPVLIDAEGAITVGPFNQGETPPLDAKVADFHVKNRQVPDDFPYDDDDE